ncbi:MAG: hypothetical protein HC899_33145 [Leptolyngbyaceae cyanobacterium SM1_4_3]|nr:hypothetical protein [Leptolyngbyaceae cyanobacterium SM1_4_3]
MPRALHSTPGGFGQSAALGLLAEQRLRNLAIPPHRQPPEASRLTSDAPRYRPHPYLLSVLQHHH